MSKPLPYKSLTNKSFSHDPSIKIKKLAAKIITDDAFSFLPHPPCSLSSSPRYSNRATLFDHFREAPDPKDPKVNQLAEFAVSQYNKETPKKLIFVGVVSSKSSFTAGTVYDIVIAAKNALLPALIENYDTGVWDQAGKWNLIGFCKV